MDSHFDIHAAARRAMIANGFVPDVPAEVSAEVAADADPAGGAIGNVRDLRALPWSSIDNDSSLDLDQLEVTEKLPNGDVRVRVAIADVDGTVPKGTATDRFAQANSVSVYTGVVTYPMLPAALSTHLTSLGQDADRPSVVIQFEVNSTGDVTSHDVFLARVKNQAKLAYGNVGAWLDGRGALAAAGTPVIQEQLRLQPCGRGGRGCATQRRQWSTVAVDLWERCGAAQALLHDPQPSGNLTCPARLRPSSPAPAPGLF